MRKHLVLVGGGHAHMVTLAHLRVFIEKGHNVTVIGPSPYHYYSGMGPGMLGRTYAPDDIRFFTQHVVEKQGGTFILGKAVNVDSKKKKLILESGETVPYDVLSFNVGSYVPENSIMGTVRDVFTVKPIEKLIDAQARILELASRKKITIGIVGGGPSAAEIAGNVWLLTQDYGKNKPKIRIFGGGDCIYFREQPLDKVGVYAVRENPILYQNLMASMEEKELKSFDPGGDYLLIFNMGDNTGVLSKNGIVFNGWLALKIKDYIDRKFMNKFQQIKKK